MYTKLILATLFSLALAAPQHQQAAQYPAGVNPQDCPNFPICDNARLHNPHAGHWGAPAAHSWQAAAPVAPHWGAPAAQPAWNQHASAWNHHDGSSAWDHHDGSSAWDHHDGSSGAAGAGAGAGGDKYPAGINPHSCPNYPFCDVNAGHHGAPVAAPPLPGWNERLYPAGVSPHECPNFPYCH